MNLRRWSGVICMLTGFFSSNVFAQDPHTVAVWPLTAQLGDIVNIQVDNATSFVKPDPSGKVPTGIVPFWGDVALKGSRLEAYDSKTGILRFTLLRNTGDPASKEAWNHVLGGFGRQNGEGNTKKGISVGRESEGPLPSVDSGKPDAPDPGKFKLVVFPMPWWLISLVVLILLLLILFLFNNMLRDPTPPPLPGGGAAARTFSLGKCQMAWWTVIVLSSYVFIWQVTGEYALPASSLVLLGISSATALGAVLAQPQPAKGAAVSSFLKDLLYEGGQPTLHRFQMFAWTIVLGIIFIVKVVNELAQPTFDPTLLTLMGISSGAYVGFKFT